MKLDQIKLVKKTWRILIKIEPKLIGDLFYSKLFADHPSLRELFPTNMELQYIKLVDMLSSLVINLENLNQNSEDLYQMGQRHVTYGVKPFHYELVGSALLWTLEKALGTDWNEETKIAWVACYTSIVAIMQKGERKE
jgi:hemoglobin-like flavoprotein